MKTPLSHKAQTAVEYMLILMIVAIVVLVGFSTFVPRSRVASETFYNRAAISIMGKEPTRLTPLPPPPARKKK